MRKNVGGRRNHTIRRIDTARKGRVTIIETGGE